MGQNIPFMLLQTKEWNAQCSLAFTVRFQTLKMSLLEVEAAAYVAGRPVGV